MPTTVISDPIIRRLREAEGFLELGMPGHALEILRARPDWATVQFEASYLTGEALRELGQFREAIASLEVAARLRPDNVLVAIAQGWCYKRTHRLAQAVDALERVRRVRPDDPMIRYNLACYWCLAGDPERGLEQLSAALELEPTLRTLIASETDFDGVRHLPEFERIVDDAGPSGA